MSRSQRSRRLKKTNNSYEEYDDGGSFVSDARSSLMSMSQRARGRPSMSSGLMASDAVDKRMKSSQGKKRGKYKPKNKKTWERLSALRDIMEEERDSDDAVDFDKMKRIYGGKDEKYIDQVNSRFRKGKKNAVNTNAVLIDAVDSAALEEDEKIHFVFDLLDPKGKGYVTREQVVGFLEAKYTAADVEIQGTNFDDIVDNIFEDAGASNKLSFKKFRQVFMGTFRRQQEELALDMPKESDFDDYTMKPAQGNLGAYMAANGSEIRFMIFYIILNLLSFGIKFLMYKYDNVSGYCSSFAKGFAQNTMLNASLAVLAMCRSVVGGLRQNKTFWKYIPLDENIEFHKVCGVVCLVTALGHTVAWSLIVVFARLATFEELQMSGLKKRTDILEPIFPDVVLLWPIWTGLVMIILLSNAYICYLKPIRMINFNFFWYAHVGLFIFYVLFIVHGGAMWVDPPQAPFWLVPPLIIYLIERRFRFSRVFGGRTRIADVHIAPDTVALFMEVPENFQKSGYQPGTYLFIQIPKISRFEWHPFTISSAPGDKYLSLHIRRAGDWTNECYDMCKDIRDRKAKDPNVRYPEVIIDGPCGAPTQDYHRYKVLVLVGGGIGVTPFASILKHIVHLWEDHRCQDCGVVRTTRSFPIEKIYFYWVTKSQESLSWFTETMNQLAEMDTENRLEIHNYFSALKRESVVEPLKLIQNYVKQEEGVDIVSGLSTKQLTHFGRPDWEQIIEDTAQKHKGTKIGVFFCGPHAIDKQIGDTCTQFNTTERYGVNFSYHSEKFS